MKQIQNKYFSPIALSSRKIQNILFFVIGIVVASAMWYSYQTYLFERISNEIKPFRQINNSYHFISPLLAYEVPTDLKELQEYKILEQKMNIIISQGKTKNIENV